MGNIQPHYRESMDGHAAWKSSMVRFLNKLNPTHFITIVWNDDTHMEKMHSDLRRLLGRLDRELLGGRFHKVPSVDRTRAYFAIEGLNSGHHHAHGLFRFPKHRWLKAINLLNSETDPVWNKIVPSGGIDVQFASPNANNDEIVGYMLKEQNQNSDSFRTIWAEDFHPVPN